MTRYIKSIEVLTTSRSVDEPIRKWATSEDLHFVASDLPVEDVLGRFQEGARCNGADIVVRANGDSPFLDPQCIDSAVDYLIENNLDCVTGKAKYTGLPAGLLGDVFTSCCLTRLSRRYPRDREHVTTEIFEGDGFRWESLPLDRVRPSIAALSGSQVHFTLDTSWDRDYLPSVLHLLDLEIPSEK